MTTSLPNDICPMCLNLGQGLWDPEYLVAHSIRRLPKHLVDANDVDHAAKKRCYSCEVVSWILEPYKAYLDQPGNKILLQFGLGHCAFVGRDFDRNLNFYGRESGHSRMEPAYMKFKHVFVQSTHCKSKNEPFLLLKSPTCPWKLLESGLEVHYQMGSIASVARVKTWFSQCLSKHDLCHQASAGQLPTRIVKIKGPTEAMLYTPKNEHAVYACLSHCWGGKSVNVTTLKNFEQYSVSIPYEDLPAAFQHAIHFAYYLDIHYLWIDSLCRLSLLWPLGTKWLIQMCPRATNSNAGIIQDSIDDWRHEGSRMSQIYENASITLSATGFSDSHKGCFAAPDERPMSRTKTFTNTDHDTYEVYCREQPARSNFPLYSRGWVFQERALSRRIVHFMEREVWWECRESLDCECGSDGHSKTQFQSDMDLTAKLSEMSSAEITEKRWRMVVENYTSKSLTYPSDIFPAIQALAKLVPSNMGRYLAGHWESTLVFSLCWYTLKPEQRQHKEWRAPSWSWAAAQGEVRWPPIRDGWMTRTYVTTLSATTVPMGEDPMGQISSGFIVLRRKCLVGEVAGMVQSARYWEGPDLRLEGLQSSKSFEVFPDSISWDYAAPQDSVQILALKIYQSHTRNNSSSAWIGLEDRWLILRAVGDVKGEYMRIGTFGIEELGEWNADRRILEVMYREDAEEMDLKII